MICSVWTFEPSFGNCVGRVRRAITTSSRDALPARSPRPLIVTSTWRAPAWTAASVLEVASPRSLWQWTLTVASLPTRSTTRLTSDPELGRDRVADRVRDVDRRRPGVDDRFVHLEEVVDVGPRRVLGGELDLGVRAERLAAVADPADRLGEGLLAGQAELVLEVDVARGDEDVEVGPLGDADRLDGSLRIAVAATGEGGDSHAALRLAGDALDGLEVAGRCGREAGLDDVDLEAAELAGDLELLGRGEPGARRLLAVAQRRVEDPNRAGRDPRAVTTSRRRRRRPRRPGCRPRPGPGPPGRRPG